MSAQQITSGGTGTTVNIQGNVENVYAVENLIETNIYYGSDTSSHGEQYYGIDTSSHGDQHNKVVAECGDGELRGNGFSRWTQTNVSSRIKNSIICDNYLRVDVHINTLAETSERDLSVQRIGDAVSSGLARIRWVGFDNYKSFFTAWKMEMTDGMTKLRDEVIKSIRSESDRRRLEKAVLTAFENCMKLMAMDSGSLIFIFQHKTKEDMDRALESSEFQQTIKQSLLDFLPSWVQKDVISLNVMQCNASAEDKSSLCQLSEPIPLFTSQSANVTPLDLRLIQGMIEKTLDNHMDSISKSQQQTLHQLLQGYTVILRDMLNEFSSNQTSLPPEDQTQLVETQHHDGSLQSDCPSVAGAPPERGTGVVVDRNSGLDEKKMIVNLESSGNEKTKGVSPDTETFALLRNLTASSVKDQNELPRPIQKFPESSVAIAAYTLEEPMTFNEQQSLRKKDTSMEYSTAGHSQESTLPVAVTEKLTENEGPQYVDPKAPHHKVQPKGQLGSQKEHYLPLDYDTKKVSHRSMIPDSKTDREKGSHGTEQSHKDGGDDSSSSDENKAKKTPQKSKSSKQEQADQLLNWVNVKSRASTSRDPEIKRMVDQVEDALQDEEKESPKAKALDTVIVMDTSDSVVKEHLDELKAVAHTFIDGIEENVDTMNLEENLAVVQMGDRAWVRQHLTNDYTRVRDAIDFMTPDSEEMPTGGRTAMFQALMVCLGALEGKGGVVSVAGCHRVRPRLIFFTDGRPTDESTEKGPDVQSNVNEVKFALVQLISEFASKKHKTTPAPIFWVPIGTNPDRAFLDSLAALSWGKVVEKENVAELCTYYKIQETIGCVYKMVRKHKELYDEQQTISVISALAGNLSQDDKDYVLDEVRKKQKDPENESADADDFDNVFEDKELVDAGHMLPLGCRVKRSKHWKWGKQDTEGPGTVIQHRKKRDGWLHVLWDNGTHNAYRYGDGECYDVEKTDKHPRILSEKELIEIGVEVRRGVDWISGDEDGNGPGIVIRKRKDAKVKVRWANGHIGKYKFGTDGKMELKVVTDCIPLEPAGQTATQAPGSEEPSDSELGATGGHDTSEGERRRIWQWKDTSQEEQKEWRMYKAETQDKLLMAYKQRADGSCIITRNGQSRRVMFKNNQEKAVDKGTGIIEVRMKMVTEQQYLKLLEEEEER